MMSKLSFRDALSSPPVIPPSKKTTSNMHSNGEFFATKLQEIWSGDQHETGFVPSTVKKIGNPTIIDMIS